jgi:phenylalanyl-tRNA synthetase beta chain
LDVVTPNFETSLVELSIAYARKVIGMPLIAKQMAALLPKAGFSVAKIGREKITVEVPCYRIDVMHPVDIVEDISIAYDYNRIRPLWRRLPTTGGVRPESGLLNRARELMVGLGFQEVLTYTLTNQENLFTKMNLKKEPLVEVANPKVQTLTCLRSWLLPSLMDFLSNNLSVEYPQRIFELGMVTLLDAKKETKTRDEARLAAVTAHANANFSEIKSALDALLINIGLDAQIEETKHPSFIDGRVGSVIISGTIVGIVGEVHPKVLETWKLENPAAAIELNMAKIAKLRA